MMSIRQLAGRLYVPCTCSISSTLIACLVSFTNDTEADTSSQFSKVFKFERQVNVLILTDLINSEFQIDSVSDNDAKKTMIIFAIDFSESGSDLSEQEHQLRRLTNRFTNRFFSRNVHWTFGGVVL